MRFSASAPVLACKQDFPGVFLARTGLQRVLNGRFNSGSTADRPNRAPRSSSGHKNTPTHKRYARTILPRYNR
jgi:hypothetical protein